MGNAHGIAGIGEEDETWDAEVGSLLSIVNFPKIKELLERMGEPKNVKGL